MSSVLDQLIREWLGQGINSTTSDLLTSFAQQAPLAMVIKELDGTISWGNTAYEHLTARSLAVLRGKKISNVWPPAYAGAILQHDQQVIEAREPVVLLETVPAGRAGHVRLTVRFPIFNPDSSLSKVAAIGCNLDDVILAQLRSDHSLNSALAKKTRSSKRRTR